MKFNLFDLEKLKEEANQKKKAVKDMLSNGKNIYKNISGHEDEPNYVLYDCGENVTGLKRHIISLTELWPGEVNEEYKMTTGHSHPQEEIYIFLKGEGNLVLKNEDSHLTEHMHKGDSMTISSDVWHRVINTGKENLEVLCFFETYEGRG